MSEFDVDNTSEELRADATQVAVALEDGSENRIDRFLRLMNDRGGSDLHLSVGRSPIMRLWGRMEPIRYRVLDDREFERLMRPTCTDRIWEDFRSSGDRDYAYEIPGLARFRVNLFQQNRGMGAVFRLIPNRLMTATELALPRAVARLVGLPGGLVLVTGPTGSGKTTTLSAIIHQINKTRPVHLITIEDPIEFVHESQKALVTQREVGSHSKGFATALRAALREDPDAILVGEMRDLETIEIALSAAETGLLVFATLHTNSAAKTIDRIINVFPAERQDGVRVVLAGVTRCVLSQQLLPRKTGGRVAAFELLLGSPALATMIREGKTHQIPGLIEGGSSQGMLSMDSSLKELVRRDVVTANSALEKALDKDGFREWCKEGGFGADLVQVDSGG